MATKLTAQQKRDREFMKLLEDYEQASERQYAAKEAKLYTMAYQDGYDHAAYLYTRLSLWQRLTRKGL